MFNLPELGYQGLRSNQVQLLLSLLRQHLLHHDYAKAAEALSVATRLARVLPTVVWKTGTEILQRAGPEHEVEVLQFYMKMLVLATKKERMDIFYEMVFYRIKCGRLNEAFDSLSSKMTGRHHFKNPLLYGYTGMLALNLALMHKVDKVPTNESENPDGDIEEGFMSEMPTMDGDRSDASFNLQYMEEGTKKRKRLGEEEQENNNWKHGFGNVKNSIKSDSNGMTSDDEGGTRKRQRGDTLDNGENRDSQSKNIIVKEENKSNEEPNKTQPIWLQRINSLAANTKKRSKSNRSAKMYLLSRAAKNLKQCLELEGSIETFSLFYLKVLEETGEEDKMFAILKKLIEKDPSNVCYARYLCQFLLYYTPESHLEIDEAMVRLVHLDPYCSVLDNIDRMFMEGTLSYHSTLLITMTKLDGSANRYNLPLWILLADLLLHNSDSDNKETQERSVTELWDKRSNWWPAFHFGQTDDKESIQLVVIKATCAAILCGYQHAYVTYAIERLYRDAKGPHVIECVYAEDRAKLSVQKKNLLASLVPDHGHRPLDVAPPTVLQAHCPPTPSPSLALSSSLSSPPPAITNYQVSEQLFNSESLDYDSEMTPLPSQEQEPEAVLPKRAGALDPPTPPPPVHFVPPVFPISSGLMYYSKPGSQEASVIGNKSLEPTQTTALSLTWVDRGGSNNLDSSHYTSSPLQILPDTLSSSALASSNLSIETSSQSMALCLFNTPPMEPQVLNTELMCSLLPDTQPMNSQIPDTQPMGFSQECTSGPSTPPESHEIPAITHGNDGNGVVALLDPENIQYGTTNNTYDNNTTIHTSGAIVPYIDKQSLVGSGETTHVVCKWWGGAMENVVCNRFLDLVDKARMIALHM